MGEYKIEVSLEEFKSRVPGLFPYIEWDENGVASTHVATDAPNGCYGRIVDNMKVPEDVILINYVQVGKNEIPSGYQWDEQNTIGMSENTDRYFSNSRTSYLRKAILYNYIKTEDEGYDYVLLDSVPIVLTDDSPEYIMTVKMGKDGAPIGCENVTLYDYYSKRGYYYYYARKEIISPCTTYSYRTLIYEYYRYRDIVGKDNTFIKFVENGIGYVETDRKLLNLVDEEKYPDVPEFVYLSQLSELIEKYEAYRKAYVYYTTYYSATGKDSTNLSEKAAAYIKMGGDNVLNWMKQMLQNSYDYANYYKCCSDNKDFPLRISPNVMISKTNNIVGLETVMENAFVPGNRYYDGDLLSNDGRTYICKLDRIVEGGDNYQYIRKSILVDGVWVSSLLMLSPTGDSYIVIAPSNITYIASTFDVPNTHDTDYVVVGNQYYEWRSDKYEPINVREYSTGRWDVLAEAYVFDTQHFIPLSEVDDYDEWYDAENLNGEKYKYFVDVDYIPSYHVYDYIRFNDSIFVWDETTKEYVAADNEDSVIRLKTDSKLRSLRVFRDYMNPFGVAEEPDNTEDWLFYYKVGNICGKTVETDDVGNIINDDDEFIENETCYGLHAYGNIITDIIYDGTANTITFKYVMGAHLLAEADTMTTDMDGNLIKYYKNFTYDADSPDGVSFVETYNCIGDDIRNLGADFLPYISGDEDVILSHAYEKFPFETVPIETFDGNMYIEGSGVAQFDANADLLHMNTIREEWMNGLYHQPKVVSGISIDRGNGASFDRHVRLGEIHTMEDFDNYQNGGFFKIAKS